MGRSLGISLTVSCILGFVSDRLMVLRNYVEWETGSGTLAVLRKEIVDRGMGIQIYTYSMALLTRI